MTKHIYLHTTDLENTKYIRNDSLFEPVPDYPFFEMNNVFRNEYGRIKTPQHSYHILVGNLKTKGCPWCNHPVDFIREEKAQNPDSYPMREKEKLYCECKQCGSRGPIDYLFINDQSEEVLKMVESRIRQKYEERTSWEKSINLEEHRLKNDV